MLTSEQWEKIDRKYGKLMYKISYQISGDRAIANFDDNLQDIRMAAMDAVVGFEKQHDGANGKFDDFWGSKGFDQYIKTCLWTKKNNKGAKIVKRYPLTKGTVSMDHESILNLEDDTYDPQFPLFLEELGFCLTLEQQALIDLVVKEPSLIKANGRLNIRRIAERCGCTPYRIRLLVSKISELLESEL